MNWNWVILTVIGTAIGMFLYRAVAWFREYEKNVNNSIALAEQSTKLNVELLNRVHLWTIVSMVLTMKLCAANNNRDDYVQMYHSLYFLGVSKDVLNDPDKLNEFLTDCMQDKIIVSDGEKPFTFSFHKRAE